MREPTLNHLVDVLGGKVLEPYKYRHGVAPLNVKNQIAEVKKTFFAKLTKDQLREIAQGLAQAGYMAGTTKKTTLGNGYTTTYTVYSLTSKGSSSVWDETVQIVLPVPDSIRESERQQEMRRQRVLQQLEAKGIKRESLPQQEVETGDGGIVSYPLCTYEVGFHVAIQVPLFMSMLVVWVVSYQTRNLPEQITDSRRIGRVLLCHVLISLSESVFWKFVHQKGRKIDTCTET